MSDVWNPEDKKGEEPFEGKFDTWKDVFDYYIKDENLLESLTVQVADSRGEYYKGPLNVNVGDYYIAQWGKGGDYQGVGIGYVGEPIQKRWSYGVSGRAEIDNTDPSANFYWNSTISLTRAPIIIKAWNTGGNFLWNEMSKFYKIDMSKFNRWKSFINWELNPLEGK